MDKVYKTSVKRRASILRDYHKHKEKYNANRKLKFETDPIYRQRVLEQRKKYGYKKIKIRFGILLRDKFTCQYCGRKAPEVVLEIDHIYPKSKGGLDENENYITACKECNLGKGDIILNK